MLCKNEFGCLKLNTGICLFLSIIYNCLMDQLVVMYCLLMKSIFYMRTGVGLYYFIVISYLAISSKSLAVILDAAATIFSSEVGEATSLFDG